MSNALGRIGFYGHPRDAFNAWARSLGSGGVVDNLIGYFSNTTLAALPLGLTFYKDFTNTSTPDADFSVGSKTATFTWSTTDSTRTYIDSDGIIQIADTVNTPRYAGGYYDSTGFHTEDTNGNSVAGLMIEGAGTNLLIRTDGTASESGLWTGWTLFESITETPTTTQVEIPELTSISGAYAQRVQATCSAVQTNKYVRIKSSLVSQGSVKAGDTITASLFARTRTTNDANFNLHLSEYDGNGVWLANKDKNGSYIQLTNTWGYYTYSVALTNDAISISAIDDTAGVINVTTAEAHGLQEGQLLTISGTTSFNETGVTISVDDSTNFHYSSIKTGDAETSGTATIYVTSVTFEPGNKLLSQGDAVDFEFYAPQLTISPYATSFIPTTTAAVTRNKEILQFPISGNLNASAQTLFIQWCPIRTPIQSGGATLFNTITKSYKIVEGASGARNVFYPNVSDSATCVVGGNNNLPINTSVVYTLASDNDASKSIHARFFINGSPSSNTPTDTDNFTSPAWGEYFYIGCDSSEANHHSAVIHKIVIFKRELSSTEITNVYNNL